MSLLGKFSVLCLFFWATCSVASNIEDATALIERAKQLSDVRADNSPPFRLSATLKLTTNAVPSKLTVDGATTLEGSFTENWVSTRQWRSDLVVGTLRRTEVANGKKKWTLDMGTSEVPEDIDDLGFHVNRGRFEIDDWKSARVQDRLINSIPVRCVESRPDPMGGKSALCFYQSTGEFAVIVFPKHISKRTVDRTCVYSDYQAFGGRSFPRNIRCFLDHKPVFEETVTEMTQTPSPDPSLFAELKGGHESLNCLVTPKHPQVIYAPDPGASGHLPSNTTVVFRALIATDGTVKELTLTRSGGPKFDEAAKSAVLQWRFKPAACGDEPFEASINIEINSKVQ